jgi:hypothetical protein
MSELPVKSEPISEVDRLRQEITDLMNSGIVEVAARNPNVLEYMRHWEGRAETAEAALAASAARIAEIKAEVKRLSAGPKVKPLEWSPGHSAKSPCGAYYIIPVDERFAVSLNAMSIGAEHIGRFATIEAAKAAAQADYEARVLSALVQP